jgi:hypothetical protein
MQQLGWSSNVPFHKVRGISEVTSARRKAGKRTLDNGANFVRQVGYSCGHQRTAFLRIFLTDTHTTKAPIVTNP